MGWKGTIRSINAIDNRITREAKRRERKDQKEIDKLQKKIIKLKDNREKILMSLKNDYASGKVSETEYKDLAGRMSDISDELIIFGKTPGVTLGKNYICGKIDKKEFENIRLELVPRELDAEKDFILSCIKTKQEKLILFKDSCNKIEENICQKCGQSKKFFKPLQTIDNITLCGSCTREYKSLILYEGFEGVYLTVEPFKITNQINLSVGIKQEWF